MHTNSEKNNFVKKPTLEEFVAFWGQKKEITTVLTGLGTAQQELFSGQRKQQNSEGNHHKVPNFEHATPKPNKISLSMN